MKHNDFSRVIAGILVLALAVGLVPVTALATEEEPETTAEEVFVGESDPMLGVQSGVEDVSARTPRSREELLSLDGVKVDENGEVISVDRRERRPYPAPLFSFPVLRPAGRESVSHSGEL